MNQRYIHRPLLALTLILAASGAAVAQSSVTPTPSTAPTNNAPNTPPNQDNEKTGQRVAPGESAQTTGTSRRDAGSTPSATDYNTLPATNAGTPDTNTGTPGTDESTVKTPDKGPQTKTKGKKRHHKRSSSSSTSDPYQNIDPTAAGRPANSEMGTTSPPMPAASK